jgi:hypothetical protein
MLSFSGNSACQIPLLLRVLCWLVIAGQTACGHSGLGVGRNTLSEEEIASVIFNVECTIDQEPREVFPSVPLVSFSLASFESFGEFESCGWKRLLEKSSGKGWVILRLHPGSYYLRVYGPAAGPQSGNAPASFWRVVVPDASAVIYAGSLHLAGRSLGRNFFGIETVEPIVYKSATLIDESEQAEVIAVKSLPDQRGMKTVLLQPWHQGEPMIFRTPGSLKRDD